MSRLVPAHLAAAIFWTGLAAFSTILSSAVPLHAETVGIGALSHAYAEAEPGETIRLAPGDHGAVVLDGGGGMPGRPVTIVSADPADPARLSGLALRGVEHVTLEGVVLDYTFAPGDDIKAKPFTIWDGRGVVLRRVLIDGDLAHGLGTPSDGRPAGFGLFVRGTEGFTLERSEIRYFWRGLNVNRSRDIRILSNDLHSLRMDGMNFAQVSDLLIEGNRIRDFLRAPDSADHADMIQFWTANTTEPTRNVTIRGNLLNSGRGLFTQSIFMGNNLVDRGKAGEEMYWRNVKIEDNLIINAHANAIAVGAAIGVRIANNTLVRNPASDGPRENGTLYRPRLSVSPLSRDVTIEYNVAESFRLPEPIPTDWSVARNIAVQDTALMQPGHYGAVFAGGDRADPASYAPRPGGPLDGGGMGAPVEAWLP